LVFLLFKGKLTKHANHRMRQEAVVGRVSGSIVNTGKPSHVKKKGKGIMVDVMADVELRRSFDRAPSRALVELYAELR
jgi:hypothetical protein